MTDRPNDAASAEMNDSETSDGLAQGPDMVTLSVVDDEVSGVVTSTKVDEDEVSQVSIGDFFRRIYQITYSKTLGLIVILAMTAYVLIGVLISQAPAGTYADEAAKASFLTQMEAKYGGWSGIFNALGFFHVFTSIGFLVVVVALAISIAGCTIHRLPQLWQQFRHPRTRVSARFFQVARYQGAIPTSMAADQATRLAVEKLKAKRYRVIEGDDNTIYVDRFSWGGIGTVAAHLAFIIILAAFFVTGLFAYEAVLTVSVSGKPVAIGQGTDITVSATVFEAKSDENGRPTDYYSYLIVRDGDHVVAEQEVRVNDPLTYDKWSFHQNTYGMSVEVTVTTRTGEELYSGAVPQNWTTSDGSMVVGQFRLEDRGLTIDVYSAASGRTSGMLAAGQVAFGVYRDGGTPADVQEAIVDQGSTGTIGDLIFAFDRESQYTGIQVRTDPGEPLMWIGSIMLVVGMTVTFTCRHRRYWMKAEDGRFLIASADKEDTSFRTNFDNLVTQAEAWFPTRRK